MLGKDSRDSENLLPRLKIGANPYLRVIINILDTIYFRVIVFIIYIREMTLELRRFLYLDSKGINSLHSQLSEFSEKERQESEQKKKSTSGKGRLNLKIFAGILGGTGETELTQTGDSEVQTERSLVQGDEQKLVEVETALSKMDSLLEINRVHILANISIERLPAYIRGRLPLTTEGWYKGDIYTEVIKSQTVSFKLIIDEFSLWPDIRMGCSLSKFVDVTVKENGTAIIGLTSHLSIILRELERCPQFMGVFGQVHEAGSYLYIKPYAIWV